MQNEVYRTLVHEMAHQWWYGIIGNDQFREPWVDESLSEYSSYLFMRDTHGTEAADLALQEWFVEPFKNSPAGPVDKPVSFYNKTNYSSLVYGRGALFYGAIEAKMTSPVFLNFLQDYFQKFRYKVATSNDILNLTQTVSGEDLPTEYRYWILGQ